MFAIFIGFLFGTINLAILLNNRIVAASAAREAGRTAAVTGSVSDAVQKGEKLIEEGGLLPFSGTVNVSNPGSNESVTTEVEYKVPVIAPGFAVLLGYRQHFRQNPR